jgi:hypothetical protein
MEDKNLREALYSAIGILVSRRITAVGHESLQAQKILNHATEYLRLQALDAALGTEKKI